MLSCSVWKAAPAYVCALSATPILGLVQVCELQSWEVLDQCAWILLLLFLFCSFFLTPSLSLSLSFKGLSHLMMGEQGKSFNFLFVSVTDHERTLSLLLFWAELCMTKAIKPTGCQSSHLHFWLCVPWAMATCQPGTQVPRREHEMIPWTVMRYASPFHAAHQLFYLAISFLLCQL